MKITFQELSEGKKKIKFWKISEDKVYQLKRPQKFGMCPPLQ